MRDHLVGCVAVGVCPTPTSHRRLEEAHTFWHRCLDNYQDPDLFRTDLNAGIQAMRNVTFALQKETAHIPGFPEWYAPWRDAMRRMPVLKWVVDARNRIVKEGDLASKSVTRANLVFDYVDLAALMVQHIREADLGGIDLQPRTLASLHEIREIVKSRNIPDEMAMEGVVVVERSWVAEAFPSSELLNALAYAFAVLSTVIADADVQFSEAPFDPDLDPATIGREGSAYPSRLRPGCMVFTNEARTTYFRLRDDDSDVGGRIRSGRPGPDKDLAALTEKYGAAVAVVGARNALDYVDAWALNGMAILRSGERHGWFVFYLIGPRIVHHETLAARDKADKWTLARHIAEVVAGLGADGVIYVGEVWTGMMPEDGAPYISPAEQPDKGEALLVDAEIAAGECRGALIRFRRSAFGIVQLEDPAPQNTASNFLSPVRAWWASQRGSRINAKE